jgi:hypothetical protein
VANSPTLVAAGIGLVFGLAGGALGTLLRNGPGEATIDTSRPVAGAAQDPALRIAVEELTREVRALHESLGNRLEAPTREVASTNAPVDLDRLVAAIETLSTSPGVLSGATGSAARHAAPLVGTDRPRNVPRLRELLQEIDVEARSRKHRFLTYQQVLDQFGAPDNVYENGTWHYDLAEAGALEFQFFDGMLIQIF